MKLLNSDYKHAHQDQILQDVDRILDYSSTAKAFLEGNQPDKATIIASPNAQPLSVDSSHIILFVPASQSSATLETVIDYYAAIVEMHLSKTNKIKPTHEQDEDERRRDEHLINLDILLKTFEIIEEIDNSGFHAIKEIKKFNFFKLYMAWKKNEPYQELVNLYWALFD